MRFSIIVPCYNLESWIRACLDSVAAQSFADWECIVVDDESQDGSPVICDAYAAKDARFRIIHQKNAGEGGARNAGLAVAKGEWVFFLDGDDVMSPRSLERLAKIVDRFPDENLIRFAFKSFSDGADGGAIIDRALPAGDESVTRVVDISRRIDYEDYFVYVWQFIFRRTMIADMKFDRYKRGEDRTFIVPVLCFKASSFVATDNVCYFYRKRPGSAVNSRASVRVLKDELSHRVDVIEAIDKSGKRMPYCKTDWLENYCLRDYLNLVMKKVEKVGGGGKEYDYSAEERKDLVAWFYHELPRICRAKDYSLMGKVYARLYRILRGRLGRYVVAVFLPKWLHRAKVVLLQPVRVVKKLTQ